MVTAIVLAAGQSTRMGPGLDKSIIQLAGKYLLWYSLEALEKSALVDSIILVRRPECADIICKIVKSGAFRKVQHFVDGGAERQNSVWNGLRKCDDNTEIVVVHDGARPLITSEIIDKSIKNARDFGSGVVARKIVDTIKEVGDNLTVIRTIDRSKLWAVQTPQTAKYRLLCDAYSSVFKNGLIVTDEAAAIETLAEPVHLVETSFINLKITTPADIVVAEALLRDRHA